MTSAASAAVQPLPPLTPIASTGSVKFHSERSNLSVGGTAPNCTSDSPLAVVSGWIAAVPLSVPVSASPTLYGDWRAC
jgi:hypothetical protein